MFSSRRKIPKKVVRDEVEPQNDDADQAIEDNGPVVRRPTVAPKTKSKLRMSFNPDEAIDGQIKEVKQRLGPSSTSQSLPQFGSDVERPSYGRSQLEELRNSTPSTPKDLSVYDASSDVDIVAKFGTSVISTSSAIPSAAEIQEKKERRARLAKEQGAKDFISLEDYDSDGEFKPQRMQVGSYLQPEKDTRLVRDDEDFAEGFDEFVDDPGRVTMGKTGLREQAKKERQAMKEMIEGVEGSEDGESDSDAERNYAYESAQTHRGMDGLAAHSQQTREANRPRQPREITPVPRLAVALSRLREAVQKLEIERVKIEARKADIKKEKADIVASQDHIQKSLEEAGRELEALHLQESEVRHDEASIARGLDSMGTSMET